MLEQLERGSPRTGDVGEKLCMAYAPRGAKGLSKYDKMIVISCRHSPVVRLLSARDRPAPSIDPGPSLKPLRGATK